METKQPYSLYKLSLCSFVHQLDHKVRSYDSVFNLQYLPPSVLIDVYFHVSRKDAFTYIVAPKPRDMHFAELRRPPICCPKIAVKLIFLASWPILCIMSTFKVTNFTFNFSRIIYKCLLVHYYCRVLR